MKTSRLRPLIRFALPAVLAGLSALLPNRAAAADENVTGNLTVSDSTTLYGQVLSTINSGNLAAPYLDYGSPQVVVSNGSSWGGLRVMGTWQGFLQLYTSTNSLGGYLRLIDAGGSPASAYFQLGFDHDSVIAMTVLDSGYVGIGTTSPSYPLDVNGDANVSGNLNVGGTVVYSNVSIGNLDISGDLNVNGTITYGNVSYGNVSYDNLAVNGSLGVGTDSPEYPFVVSTSGGSADNAMGSIGGPTAVITTGGAWGGLRIMGASQGYLQLYTATNSLGGYVRVIDAGGSPATAYMQMGFDHDSVIAMTILDSGYIGIGTTSPAHPLDVNGDVNSSGNLTTDGTVNGEKVVVSSEIDATATGNTTVYTPPSGKSFSVTSIAIENVDVTSLSVPAELTLSAGETSNDVTSSLTLTSAAAGQEFKAGFTAQPYICTDSTPLTLRVTTGSTATTHTIKVVVTGVVY